MKQFLFGLSVSLAFCIGCATAVVATDLAVPPARSADVQKWEYACKKVSAGVTEMANAMGSEGWELTASAGAGGGQGGLMTTEMIWCFKRPL